MASLLKAAFTGHAIGWTLSYKASLKAADDEVKKQFFRNCYSIFINNNAPDGLPGKYKPSWEAEFPFNPLRTAILTQCVQKQAHHYHFGYKSYDEGNDGKYPGKVSGGILHTKLVADGGILRHIVFAMHTKHPKPFYCPIHLINDPVDTSESIMD